MDAPSKDTAPENGPMLPNNQEGCIVHTEEPGRSDLRHRASPKSVLVGILPEIGGSEESNETAKKTDVISSTSARTAFRNDILLLTCVCFSLIWPWIWYGILKAKGGIELSSDWARYILGHPQQLSAIVTLIGSLNSIAVTFLFGCAISRYGQEFVVSRTRQRLPPTVFDVSALLAFRYMSVMWGVEDVGQLFSKRRRIITVGLLFAVLGGSALIPSGTASLITPVTFNRRTRIMEKEVNFASTDTDCLAWLERIVDGNCFWMPEELNSQCLHEDRMLDVLESGKILAHHLYSKVTELQRPISLPSGSNIQFLGPSHGVLPTGSSSPTNYSDSQGTDFLTTSKNPMPFLESSAQASLLSFNYTLSQQGLLNNVSCTYDTTSPLRFMRPNTSSDSVRLPVLQYTGSCRATKEQHHWSDAEEQESIDMPSYTILGARNTLVSWVCKGELAKDPPYVVVYLWEWGTNRRNVTCTIWEMRPEVYSVTYTSSLDYFTAEKSGEKVSSEAPQPPSRSRFNPSSMEYAIAGIHDLIAWAQTRYSNFVVDSVETLASNNLSGLGNYDDGVLRSYEAMIQGILDYKMTSQRLVYHLAPERPESCVRIAEGSLEYSVFGWYIDTNASYVPTGLLLSLTLMNIATLAILLIAFHMGRFKYKYRLDPTDPHSLLTATVEGTEPTGLSHNTRKLDWDNSVMYMEV